MVSVELVYFFSFIIISGGCDEFFEDAEQAVVFNFFTVISYVSVIHAIKITATDFCRVYTQFPGNAVNYCFDHCHCLRCTKSSESCIGWVVCLPHFTCQMQIGNKVGIINMEHRSFKDSIG